MITKAHPEIDSENKIILSVGEKKMILDVISPENAQLFILPAEGGEGEALNPDYIRVGFTAQLVKDKVYEICVKLTPIQ